MDRYYISLIVAREREIYPIVQKVVYIYSDAGRGSQGARCISWRGMCVHSTHRSWNEAAKNTIERVGLVNPIQAESHVTQLFSVLI